jgi:hypothetical protein
MLRRHDRPMSSNGTELYAMEPATITALFRALDVIPRGPIPNPELLADPMDREALQAFQATRQERLQRVIPPHNTRPVRVFSQDESRVGLLTVRRRRLTTRGVQPVGSVQHVFERFDV